MSPRCGEYFIALSSRMVMIWRTGWGWIVAITSWGMACCMRSFLALALGASVCATSVISCARLVVCGSPTTLPAWARPSSESLKSRSRVASSTVRLITWRALSGVRDFLRSATSLIAIRAARGVRSSWLASDTNWLWRSKAASIGARVRRLKR